MPVLFTLSNTSPSFSSAPFCTSSSEGCASATHRSCAGFVKTPILGLLGLTSVEAMVGSAAADRDNIGAANALCN
jgi:hypothetical protein